MIRLSKQLPSRLMPMGRSLRSSMPIYQNCNSRRQKHTVNVQLDYYMSPQFAGIASAMTNNLYDQKGIDLNFLPICPVGLEMDRVRKHHDSNNASTVSVGSVEQNIFIPTLSTNPDLKMKAVAAMFRQSPLCLASLHPFEELFDKKASSAADDGKENMTVVGAHEDTVSLLERILSATEGSDSNTSVLASPRASKNTDLITGKVNAIQAYTTTEVPTLERQTTSSDQSIFTTPLEGMNGAKLGYSQVLFAPEEDLQNVDKREMVQAFLEATFDGWELAIRDHEMGAKSVEEVKTILGLNEENNDHWDSSFSYQVQTTKLCSDLVKESFQGDRYGVINAKRWNEATSWLLEEESGEKLQQPNFGLDTTQVWQPSSQLLAGNELARTTLDSARTSAVAFEEAHGRKPSLAVLTVGELPRYTNGERRLDIYSNDKNSWFSKPLVGDANGFTVKEINLAESTTEDELLSQLYTLLQKNSGIDGIQLMWPLPPHINPAKVYGVIPLDRDVDGAHYIGQMELATSSHPSPKDPIPPVTPAAVMELMNHYNMDVLHKSVLVIGRSRIVGSPLAHMLRQKGAIITVAHSEVPAPKLEELVRSADLIVSCAGCPGLLKAEWVKPGADVINVGTTFREKKDDLCSDFDGDLAQVAQRFSPVPGGIGPLSVAFLFKNVAAAAWERATIVGDVDSTWTNVSGSLQRSIHFKDYDSALNFANKVNSMSSDLDHHANMVFCHKCADGVDLKLDFFTWEANEITDKDYKAARNVNAILEDEKINMHDFTYNLKLNSIAKYPAEPRGSSRLIKVDSNGTVSHYNNFSESFFSLVKGAHIVFNESKVVNARLDVRSGRSKDRKIELMILDMGNSVDKKCNGVQLTVMIRSEKIQAGDIFTEARQGKAGFRVIKVRGPWIEDEHSNGNGTECIVECIIEDKNMNLACLLKDVGTVPIPPYLGRDAESSDEEAYNNVYAAGTGSVAAPTAGLHFTNELLTKIGDENMSFLSLHVGAGTFKPVVTKDARDHSMHGEHFSVSVNEIRRIIQSIENGKRIVVVGTTSCRTLESLYWCGVKILQNQDSACVNKKSNEMMTLQQNEWSILSKRGSNISTLEALKAVIEDKSTTDNVQGRTSLMIVPGTYDFKVVNELVTNFHAPDSTLMLLVSAFLGGGEKVRDVYHEAQDLGYRFLSFGDVCFFSKPKK